MSDFQKAFDDLKNNSALLRDSCPDVMKDFASLHHDTIKDKAVSAKNKELIALGIAIAVRCEGCILSHVRGAIKHGATMEELNETVEVAILMGGGPSTVYGGKALAVAQSLLTQ